MSTQRINFLNCNITYAQGSRFGAFRCGFPVNLTLLSLDKMTAILADNFKCVFLNQNDRIPIRISLSLIDNKATLVPVMAWR